MAENPNTTKPQNDSAKPDNAPLTLASPVHLAPNVGERRAALLQRLNIYTVADLIKHLPSRYEFHAGRTPIAELPLDVIATAHGTVHSCRWIPGRGSPIGRPGGARGPKGRFTAQIRDASGFLDIVWFNARYLIDRVHPGTELIVTGKVTLYRDARQMTNPNVQVVEPDTETFDSPPIAPRATTEPTTDLEELPTHGSDFRPVPHENATPSTQSKSPNDDERYRPIYPATEDLPTGQIERAIRQTLPLIADQIEDHFTPEYRQERRLPTLADAYTTLHNPADEDAVLTARRRLAYDELLLLQLGFALKRKHNETDLAAPALRHNDAINKQILERFPFPLTNAQDRVVNEIATDLQSTTPMNRLLQGDVGSGKTVVALYALLLAVSSGKQGALMAPTELLAEQHFVSISNMLTGSTVRLALLTGSLTPDERASLNRQIEAGDIDIVVGTHAMLSESVRFADPAVIVVDEQHRFGVVQRATIRSKSAESAEPTKPSKTSKKKTKGKSKTKSPGSNPLAKHFVPHTLVMTATPIPRTLSLTVFGDLDVSTIDQLPPGRQPITTRVVSPLKSPKVYEYLAERVAAGEQAYIVLPAIEESSTGLKDVRSMVKQLEQGPLQGKRIAAVHGRLKRITRERIMHRFRKGEIDALVATTVIEVGVDVPNASIMVVEHAERFGLAQLHQLRGRVGRGSNKSVCAFIAEPTTEDAAARMKAIAATTDGFKIAEADLKIRGMGELLGTKQAGASPLQIADLTKHLVIVIV